MHVTSVVCLLLPWEFVFVRVLLAVPVRLGRGAVVGLLMQSTSLASPLAAVRSWEVLLMLNVSCCYAEGALGGVCPSLSVVDNMGICVIRE